MHDISARPAERNYTSLMTSELSTVCWLSHRVRFFGASAVFGTFPQVASPNPELATTAGSMLVSSIFPKGKSMPSQ